MPNYSAPPLPLNHAALCPNRLLRAPSSRPPRSRSRRSAAREGDADSGTDPPRGKRTSSSGVGGARVRDPSPVVDPATSRRRRETGRDDSAVSGGAVAAAAATHHQVSDTATAGSVSSAASTDLPDDTLSRALARQQLESSGARAVQQRQASFNSEHPLMRQVQERDTARRVSQQSYTEYPQYHLVDSAQQHNSGAALVTYADLAATAQREAGSSGYTQAPQGAWRWTRPHDTGGGMDFDNGSPSLVAAGLKKVTPAAAAAAHASGARQKNRLYPAFLQRSRSTEARPSYSRSLAHASGTTLTQSPVTTPLPNDSAAAASSSSSNNNSHHHRNAAMGSATTSHVPHGTVTSTMTLARLSTSSPMHSSTLSDFDAAHNPRVSPIAMDRRLPVGDGTWASGGGGGGSGHGGGLSVMGRSASKHSTHVHHLPGATLGRASRTVGAGGSLRASERAGVAAVATALKRAAATTLRPTPTTAGSASGATGAAPRRGYATQPPQHRRVPRRSASQPASTHVWPHVRAGNALTSSSSMRWRPRR